MISYLIGIMVGAIISKHLGFYSYVFVPCFQYVVGAEIIEPFYYAFFLIIGFVTWPIYCFCKDLSKRI